MSGNKIIIAAADITLEAELNGSETAKQIFDILPVEGRASVWGEEIYFEIPLQLAAESDARAEVNVGELGYWPTGSAFCIFFGPTPVSTGDKPQAYSPVNVFGQVVGDAKQLLAVADQTVVRVMPA
ncbi:MAG: hypothetical protein AMJ54_05680 [Deltaproteobacteria bacterium SG8_13]|nr:MAG: hypothetical protein AMJ54_05680 [Deltaproteobacteria bacterium SG8_13]